MSAPPLVVGQPAQISRTTWRNLIVPVALAVLAAALTFIALRSERYDSLQATVRVMSIQDPYEWGATTRATVEVRNDSERDIRPRFSVTWLPYPYYWSIISGPPLLKPGQAATYVIEARDSTSAPRHGQAFNIRVNDGRSIAYAISETLKVNAKEITVRNPDFAGWSKSDPATGATAPAGWNLYERQGTGDETDIGPADAFGVHAVRLRVAQDGQPDPGGWSHAGLTQEIPFPDKPLEVTVLTFSSYQAEAGGWPLTGFGVEIDDPRNGLAWILFQSTGLGNLEYDLPSGHHILVIDAPTAQWSTQTIDLGAMYRRAGWLPADTLTLKIFVAASSARANTVEGYISRLGLTD